MRNSETLIHATAVAINGQAILLMGASGSGKSDLAIRLIDRGAVLVSDDYCDIVEGADGPEVHAKSGISGKIEVRGVGICECDHIPSAPLAMALTLDSIPERLPSDNDRIELAGWSVPAFALSPFETSAPLKVEMLLHRLVDARRRPMRLETSGYNRGTA
ncbi:aldolase [uncultured Sphingorhabdus sp.]|uniref:HPr kinase/phosphorylase n=1 Tax=uncultured Sphingorhabdus sp. TaxID=1686106 RepID=UPI00263746D8|nr:aldolase [uncultured Sphingorhabdus sp.]HMS21702.1 aldolase [Sphingorhabdus sp.]